MINSSADLDGKLKPVPQGWSTSLTIKNQSEKEKKKKKKDVGAKLSPTSTTGPWRRFFCLVAHDQMKILVQGSQKAS